MRRVLATVALLGLVVSACGPPDPAGHQGREETHSYRAVGGEAAPAGAPGDADAEADTDGPGDAPSAPPEARPPAGDPIAEPPPPAGLVAYDPYRRLSQPTPPLRALLALPACAPAGALGDWAVEALAPFGALREPLQPVPLADVADTTPVLTGTARPAACAVALASAEAQAWELRDAGGAVLGRGVASERLAAQHRKAYERQEQLGGVNFGQSAIASGQYVAGVWRGERMELELFEVEPRRTALLVTDWPGGGEPTRDLEGQQRAEVRAAALSTATLDIPGYRWMLPVPRALPPGFVRCSGPAPHEGFQASLTVFCDDAGRAIRVTTDNKGSNPVPDPPARTSVEERDGRFHVRIVTAVEDVEWFVPAELGRAVLDGMLSTVPMLDRRVWFPASGRGEELKAVYSAEWWRDTLARAGARDIEVREQPLVCTLVGGAPPCTPPPGPKPYEGEATAPDGARVTFHVFAPKQRPESVTMGIARAVTVGGTDILLQDGYAPDAWAWCGGVQFSLRPEGVGTTNRTDWDGTSAARLLAGVLRTLDC